MAKPKLKQEIDDRITRSELYEVLKDLLSDVTLNDYSYSKKQIDELITGHSHDHQYVTLEQFALFDNDDFGPLFDDETNEEPI